MALLTTAQAKSRMPALSGTDQDALIDDLVGVVDWLFASFCGFPVASGALIPTMESATYVLRLDGPRTREGRALDLGISPLVSITSIYESSTWDFAAATVLVEDTDYEAGDADLAHGVLWKMPSSTVGGGEWLRGTRAIKATVVAGFAVPLADTHPLVELGALAVSHLLDRPHVQGRRSAALSGQTVQPDDLDDLIPAAVRLRLAPFVQWGGRCG